MVVVDPVRTRTAEAADWHLPIAPAGDAALALAMMHVMVRDDLVDRDYVDCHAVGFDALGERVSAYSPAAMAATVGLPAEDIERFARDTPRPSRRSSGRSSASSTTATARCSSARWRACRC